VDPSKALVILNAAKNLGISPLPLLLLVI